MTTLLRPRNVLIIVAFLLWITVPWGCSAIGPLAPSPSKEDIATWSAPLSPEDAKALRVYHSHHSNIYDARIHSGDTCPILVYSPTYARFKAGTMSADAWAAFLLRFFRAKHKEEGGCKCAEELGLPSDSPPTVKNPCPVVLDGTPCGKPSTKYKADATVKYMRCTAGHEWEKRK